MYTVLGLLIAANHLNDHPYILPPLLQEMAVGIMMRRDHRLEALLFHIGPVFLRWSERSQRNSQEQESAQKIEAAESVMME